ncbi:hypothetical protein ABW19_dt0202621 [Dactylella cylindrospora]|nr:hypothetical protein ABW19_dt0202621 [Dactylella cylindrospora]
MKLFAFLPLLLTLVSCVPLQPRNGGSSIAPRQPVPEEAVHIETATIVSRQTAPSQETIRAETDRLIFNTPLAQFIAAFKARTPSYVLWPDPNVKACSSASDYPLGFNFRDSCLRHDFGYLNYRDQKRFCKPGRKLLDNQFEKDLRGYCAGRSWWKRPVCYATAATYAAFVRWHDPPYSEGC